MSRKTYLVSAIRKESIDLPRHMYGKLLDEFDLTSYSLTVTFDLPIEKLQRLLNVIREETKK